MFVFSRFVSWEVNVRFGWKVLGLIGLDWRLDMKKKNPAAPFRANFANLQPNLHVFRERPTPSFLEGVYTESYFLRAKSYRGRGSNVGGKICDKGNRQTRKSKMAGSKINEKTKIIVSINQCVMHGRFNLLPSFWLSTPTSVLQVPFLKCHLFSSPHSPRFHWFLFWQWYWYSLLICFVAMRWVFLACVQEFPRFVGLYTCSTRWCFLSI